MIRANSFMIMVLCSILALDAIGAQSKRGSGPPDRYIVQVNEGFIPGQVGRGVAQRTSGKLVHVYTNAVKGFSIFVPPGLAKKDIESQPGVLLAEPDVQVYAVAQTLPTGVDRIEADNSGVTGPVDVDIAIIDTGIDTDHPDLNVVGGRHFYSLLGLISFEDDLYDDDNGHGSHCAGIAAAKNNDEGVVGMAPGARLWAVKVLDSSGSGYLSDVIAGIDWVTARAGTIEVANMSLAATANSSAFRTAVQNSVAAGIFYAVAAGNDGKDVYGYDGILGTSDDVIPAAYPEAATISALADSDGLPGGLGGSTSYGADDSFASFSNYSASVAAGNPVTSPGKAVDLLMPGVDIYSCSLNGGYATHSGTSMASPHAAGLAALYIASHGRANDADGVYDIRQALINAGVAQADPDLGLAHQNDPDPYKENIGWAGSTEPPVSGPPLADFVGNPTVGEVPLEVFFIDRSTGTITSWSWDFGDGETSTARNPSHIYNIGTYTVTLTVTNAEERNTKTKIDYITVTEQVPVADFSASPTSGDAPLTVNFTDLSTGSPTSWSWDFGDSAGTSTDQNPSYTYGTPGAYTVTLTATNANGSDDEIKEDYINVTAPSTGPLVADFDGNPIIGNAPLTVNFKDLSSGNPLSWGWHFGNGDALFVRNPSYTYYVPGAYDVTLAISDGYYLDMVTKVGYINVTAQSGNPPVADFLATPTSGEAPITVQFTDLSADNPTSWLWDFGDGIGTSTAQNPSYEYANAGYYTVALTATNANGSDTLAKINYITVDEPSVGITLTATGYKVKGRKTAELEWSGAYGGTVKIYRDGDIIATPENNGSYTDATDSRGGGSFTYQVCEEGTSTCSNEVTVYY